jgi:DNA polymerase-1
MKRLAVIDGKSVFYRGYYAMPQLNTSEGTPTGGVYGFAALSLELIRKVKPDYVVVAWDKPKTNIRRRKELYPDYKAGRKPAPPDFYAQIPILHDLLEGFGWPLVELDDYEADDIMGSLALQAQEQGIETALITGDMDLLQVVSPQTHVYIMKKGFTDIALYNPESFEEKYGLRVDQFLDLKALKGDSSDNIPGVPGVGEKTAITLLQKYETLDAIYDHLDEITPAGVQKKLREGKDSAYLSKEIGRIWTDAPYTLDLAASDVHDFDAPHVRGLLEKLEFRSLIKRLPDSLGDSEAAPTTPSVAPFTMADFDDKARVALTMADHVFVTWTDDSVVASIEAGSAYRLSFEQAVEALSGATIIAHDAKIVIKKVMQFGIKDVPSVLHDTRIGGFLLNSLHRSGTLEEVMALDLSADDGSLAIAALTQLYDDQSERFKSLEQLHALAKDTDFALIPVLARMEVEGVKIDSGILEQKSREMATELEKLEKEMYEMAGYEFNIGSPSQLAEVLFTKLQLPTGGIKRGKTGYSTGQKELDKLRGLHPIIELIEKTRELAKLKSTYVDALPKLADSNDRVHTTFNQDVASTGRLSSTDPNLQNIPIRSELGRSIRQAFTAEEGNLLVSADYSQFELRLAAVLAGDKDLIDDYNQDLDVHTKTASDVYGIPYDQVTKNQRRDAKVINFGVLYGMSPHGLSAATGMSFSEAKKFIDSYFALRAPIRRFIDETLQKAKDEGYVQTLFGRRRPTPDVNSSNFMIREGAKRAAANMPIQGTEADLMKMAMIEVDNKLDGRGIQILQIHDSILVECPAKNADEIGAMLKSVMETIYPKLGIKLRVDVSSGKNWGEL